MAVSSDTPSLFQCHASLTQRWSRVLISQASITRETRFYKLDCVPPLGASDQQGGGGAEDAVAFEVLATVASAMVATGERSVDEVHVEEASVDAAAGVELHLTQEGSRNTRVDTATSADEESTAPLGGSLTGLASAPGSSEDGARARLRARQLPGHVVRGYILKPSRAPRAQCGLERCIGAPCDGARVLAYTFRPFAA